MLRVNVLVTVDILNVLVTVDILNYNLEYV